MASDFDTASSDDIAIIGMAARLPGAPDVDTFWKNVRDGVESITTLSEDALIEAGVRPAELKNPDYVKACPVLDDIDKFDASFFGLNPREASVMDPAHRVFLEIAWAAFENAGYAALPEDGQIGVFATAGAPDYYVENVRTNPDIMRSMGDFLVRHTGNDMNFLATRVSYEMDLRGPSMNVQTACSSGLSALHLAAQSLRRGECDMALVGGATILIPHGTGYMYREGEILSPDGHCRPFDAQSAGTVFGSGAGALIVKRLDDALDSGDTIHAVMKGSAINNDGAQKVGYLAPGIDGQAKVIEDAIAAAKIPGETVSYIETHGTGTLVGDPIEFEALREAYGQFTSKKNYCGIGSVKSNIGHLGETAAIASLIKAVMALKNRQLPPSLGFNLPNPAMELEDSPFYVNATLKDWTSDGPLRCGVTALGAGGTNCHVILEEAPAALPGDGARERNLLLLSAKSQAALEDASANLAAAIEADQDLDLADASFTLAVGRRAMPFRKVIVAEDRESAIQRLRNADNKLSTTIEAPKSPAKTVFMFPGGGAQFAGMGRDLYESEDAYREAFDECLALINNKLGRDLKSLVFPPLEAQETATRTLETPSLTLPSLFATSYALASLYESWGLKPDALIGHSMGEYVAACKAGVFTLEDAISLVMLRGELFDRVERGGMLSVPLSEEEAKKFAPNGLDFAAVNAPDLCVASGPVQEIEAMRAALSAQDIESTSIRIDVAAHSRMLDPILDTFRQACQKIDFHPPQVPLVSNLTGSWLSPSEATDPEYWVKHLRSTVRFSDGLSTLRTLGETVLVEMGPGRTLSMLAKAQSKPFANAINTMRHPQEAANDVEYALASFGKSWAAGADPDWEEFFGDQLRNRIPLPTYAFRRDTHWVDPGQIAQSVPDTELYKRDDLSEWFAELSYREESLIHSHMASMPKRWVVFAGSKTVRNAIVSAIAQSEIITITPGRTLQQRSDDHWEIDFDDPEQYVRVLENIENTLGLPDHIVFSALGRVMKANTHEALQSQNFFSLTYLMQALAGTAEQIQVSVLTSGISDVGGENIDPIQSLTLGPVLTTPRELTHVSARCIDLPKSSFLRSWSSSVLARLGDELRNATDDKVVVLRERSRWVRTIAQSENIDLDQIMRSEADWLRDDGVYLITGGLGGIGLAIARYMATQKPLKLALLSRQGLPPESDWDMILSNKIDTQTAALIREVLELRNAGAKVLVLRGDVTDPVSLSGAVDTVRRSFGPLNGVIHAAGIMDDAPMMTKDTAEMQRVLDPKVLGTLNLDRVITEKLDAFVLFSSIASFLGLPGQIDYTAANAFLDAFGKKRAKSSPGRSVVINWNAWREVGMAARLQSYQNNQSRPVSPLENSIWDGFTSKGEHVLFQKDFSYESDWLVHEHVTQDGVALLSGTSLLELARSAAQELLPDKLIQLSNLTFLTPFAVPKEGSKRLTLLATQIGENTFEMAFRRGGVDPESPPIAICEASSFSTENTKCLMAAHFRERMTEQKWTPKDRFLDQHFMAFGPRWANIKSAEFGTNEALVALELPSQFTSDLDLFFQHPAVLDMATGGAQKLIPGVDLKNEFYVPLSYDNIRVYQKMPASLYSHVTCLAGSGDGIAYFDVVLFDAAGTVIAEINRFTMKKLDSESTFSSDPSQETRASVAGIEHEILEQAIAPNEGVRAFNFVMEQPSMVQMVVSSVDTSIWQHQLDDLANKQAVAEHSGTADTQELAANFKAPETPVEIEIAAIWSNLLGIKTISTKDDFFELGGNSLIGVRLFAAIRKKYGVSLPLATLFEAPSISNLAELLKRNGIGASNSESESKDVERTKLEWSPLVRLKDGKPGLRGIFAIHGARGNILQFKALSDRLADSRPVYGLQAFGTDGIQEPLDDIVEMARRYISHVREVQPHGPYTLAGYSGGGVIAYEMSQQLKQAGEEVDVLVMFDTIHPHATREKVSLSKLLRSLPKLHPSILTKGIARRLQWLPVAKNYLHAREEGLNDTTELEIASTRVWNAFHIAQDKYEPKPYEGHVVIVRAKHASLRFLSLDSSLGWAQHLTSPHIGHDISATHESLFEKPAIIELAKIMRVHFAGSSDV